MTFFSLLLLFTGLYSLMIILFTVAAVKAKYHATAGYRPFVSIIIAARNEEQNIGNCLQSLSTLSYPRDLFEIIIVDDRSADSTASIVRTFAADHPWAKLITAEPGSGEIQGKTNALTQGIDAAKGEILLFTDADCIVRPEWIERTVSYYADESIGVVAGFTELRAKGQFEEMQTLDWLFLFTVAAATIRLRYPVTAVGNNLSVRKKAYDLVGGYRKIPFSVTEDYALFHAITATKSYRARFPMDPSMLVKSAACSTLTQLHNQKLRWFRGGRDMELKSMGIFGGAYLLNAFLLGGIFVLPAHQIAVALGMKIVVDIGLLLPALMRFKRMSLLRSFPLFEGYFLLYVLLYPVLILLGHSVIWKERSF